MDMLLLIALRRILGYTATYLNCVAAAVIGATWACISLFYRLQNTLVGKICTYIFIAAIMVKICAGKCNYKKWIRDTLLLYGIAAVFGGIGHMLMYYTRAGYFIKTVIMSDKALLISLLISFILIMAIANFINIHKLYEQKMYRVMLVINGESVVLRAFYDTGNVLRDPLVQRAVHIVEEKSIETILEKIDDLTQVKMHLIPFSSMGCENGLIQVITADLMYIYCQEEVKIIKSPLLGLTKQHLSQDGAYEMLINGSTF